MMTSTSKMSLTNWLFETCGRNHIGMYTCSKCGYELLRSNFEKSFVKKSSSNILPPSTIAARARDNKNVKSKSFTISMVEDFKKNFDLGRMMYKNSILKEYLRKEEDGTEKYQLSCGKCGNILGQQVLQMERSSLKIKFDSLDLTFKPS